MRKVWMVLIVCGLALSSAAAKPLELEPHDVGSVSVSMPKGWTFAGDASKGTAIAQQDPKRKDAAQILVMVSQNAGATTEDQILDGLAGQAMKGMNVVSRGPGPNKTGKMLVADGTVDGIHVRLGAFAVSASGTMIVGLLIAKSSDFGGLGGTDLVLQVIGSLRATAQGSAPVGNTGAPAGDTSAPPPAAGGARSQIMEAQFDSYHSQIIPPVTSRLTVADMAGQWHREDGASSTYVDSSSGVYAGHKSVSISETWKIDAKGNISDEFTGATTGIGGGAATQSKDTGTAFFDDQGVLVLKWKSHPRERYIVRGWFWGKDQAIMRLHGPHYDNEQITSEMISNPRYNVYENHDYKMKR